MKIGVGSTNEVKLNAVRDTLLLYPDIFPEPEIVSVDVEVEEFGHPKNIEQTTKGAVDRAKESYVGNNYGFGLESGLVEMPYSKTGFLEIQICAIYDGHDMYIGSAPGFEWPPAVAKLIASGKADGSKAFKDAGLTDQDRLGSVKGGIIGVLTKGRLTREDQAKHSIIMALIQIENPEMY